MRSGRLLLAVISGSGVFSGYGLARSQDGEWYARVVLHDDVGAHIWTIAQWISVAVLLAGLALLAWLWRKVEIRS